MPARRSVLSACLLVLLTMPGLVSAQNDSPTKDIYFTFSQPVTVPNMTLEAGKYLFRHNGPNTGRTTLQIVRVDSGKTVGTLMTVQAARSVAPQRPEIRFLETAADVPPAVSTWWYPAQTQGWEFVYPRQQAEKLSKTAKQPILTTAKDVSSDEMKSSDLVRLEPSGSQSAYSDAAAPAPAPLAGTAQRGEFAEADQAANTVADASRTAPRQSASAARTNLPQTASSAPFVTLMGVVLVGAWFGMRLWRRSMV